MKNYRFFTKNPKRRFYFFCLTGLLLFVLLLFLFACLVFSFHQLGFFLQDAWILPCCPNPIPHAVLR